MRDFLPSDVASETPVVSPVELSSLRTLMMWRMYLTRMRTMQALPTTQQHSTGCFHVSCVRWYGTWLKDVLGAHVMIRHKTPCCCSAGAKGMVTMMIGSTILAIFVAGAANLLGLVEATGRMLWTPLTNATALFCFVSSDLRRRALIRFLPAEAKSTETGVSICILYPIRAFRRDSR
jgi:hypothetical protein